MSADGVILAQNGEPFQSKAEAEKGLKVRELAPDAYIVIKYHGGWAIANVAVIQSKAISPGPPPVLTGAERFFVVKFQGKSDRNQPDDVNLSVNGRTLVCQREVNVILPECYLEVADHATYAVYRQLPGVPRQVTGRVKKYPYERLAESSRADFEAAREQGNAKRDQALKIVGMGRPEGM
jgi:hypothetical protein